MRQYAFMSALASPVAAPLDMPRMLLFGVPELHVFSEVDVQFDYWWQTRLSVIYGASTFSYPGASPTSFAGQLSVVYDQSAHNIMNTASLGLDLSEVHIRVDNRVELSCAVANPTDPEHQCGDV